MECVCTQTDVCTEICVTRHKRFNLKELKKAPSLAFPYIIIKMVCMSREGAHSVWNNLLCENNLCK